MDLDLLDNAMLIERQVMISRCFPIDSFRHVMIPSHNRGLAADDLKERFPFVVSLILVMKSWKGDKPAVFATSTENLLDLSELLAINIEKIVAKYYCQQFFNYFGRAAQIPRHLYTIKQN
jgi:hypothetical protein